LEILENKALMLRLRNPNKVTAVIPKSKALSNNRVIVNWGVEEAKVLRNLNIKAPSPIEGRYDWPGSYKPFKHQIETASFFTMNQRSYCFSEMGSGKTASAIWASDYLLKSKIINRVLIICPLSIMDAAWRNDLFTVAMHRTVDIAYGSAEKRRKIIQGNAEYIIINFDGIEIVSDEIANGGFDLIIVDEANAYKNPQTKRWKVLNSLVKPHTWLWMMTGTPAAQSPVDAFGLAKMMNPNSVPRYMGSFKDMVMSKVTQFKWVAKPDAMETVHRVLQPAIRFTKDECLDLPPMTYVKRDVELTPQQKKYYTQLKKKMRMLAAGEEISAANAAIIMNKLLQISGGAVYSDNNETVEFDISNRYKVLKETIEESSKKVLVFAPFKHTIDLLLGKLRSDNITCEMIRGDVTPAKRTEIFARFQEKADPQVLVIQPQAAAHGVTLTAANTVVWWGPTSSLEIYHQANARVHRSGQTHPCTIVQLQGSDVERHVYKLLDNRIDVHSKIVDLYKKLLD
jgi:SNF2 family DNA or RNA helicase